jgi:hypothetical protein
VGQRRGFVGLLAMPGSTVADRVVRVGLARFDMVVEEPRGRTPAAEVA